MEANPQAGGGMPTAKPLIFAALAAAMLAMPATTYATKSEALTDIRAALLANGVVCVPCTYERDNTLPAFARYELTAEDGSRIGGSNPFVEHQADESLDSWKTQTEFLLNLFLIQINDQAPVTAAAPANKPPRTRKAATDDKAIETQMTASSTPPAANAEPEAATTPPLPPIADLQDDAPAAEHTPPATKPTTPPAATPEPDAKPTRAKPAGAAAPKGAGAAAEPAATAPAAGLTVVDAVIMAKFVTAINRDDTGRANVNDRLGKYSVSAAQLESLRAEYAKVGKPFTGTPGAVTGV